MAQMAQAPADNIVGHYQILGKVGAGGMGVVFKAFDTQLQRTVALKFLTSDPTHVADRESLLREARAASTLDHKNIASVHAVEETDDGQLFIVMAYCEGQSLATRMSGDPLSPTEAVHIVRQIAEGLGHAHLHHLVHRDIKPSNVILTSEGEAKIVDFGLARIVGPAAPTQTLSLAGTLAYMSPEQLSGKAVDARTDIWSLGVIAYQLLTNHLPFPDGNPASTINAILHSPPAELEGVPPELQWIVQRALAKRLPDRYQSCAELVRDLEATDIPTNRSTARPGKLEFRRFASLSLASRAVRLDARAHGRRWTLMVALVFLTGTLAVSFRKQVLFVKNAQTVLPPAAYESYLHGQESLERYDKPGNLDAAVRLFETATKADPKFALAFAALGEAYWDKYRFDQDPRWVQLASASCQRAAELNDQLPAVHITLGRIHDGTGEHQLALQEFHHALELDHSNADALLGLADAYSSMGRNREAEDTYQRAVAMRPEHWDGHYRLGIFYYNQGRYTDAASRFRRVIELTPDNAQAHSTLGTALVQHMELDEAEVELKKSIALQPTYYAFSNLSLVYYQQERWARAAEMLEAALQLNSSDFRVWANLGMAYDWLNERDKAAEAYRQELIRLEEVAKIKPDDAAIQCERSLLYARQHLRTKAISMIQIALARAPEEPDILGCVAEVYETLGDRARALAQIEKALKNGSSMNDLEHNPGLRSLLLDPTFRAVGAQGEAASHR